MTRTRALLSCVVTTWVLSMSGACTDWFDSDLNRFVPPDSGKPADAPSGDTAAPPDTGTGSDGAGGDSAAVDGGPDAQPDTGSDGTAEDGAADSAADSGADAPDGD